MYLFALLLMLAQQGDLPQSTPNTIAINPAWFPSNPTLLMQQDPTAAPTQPPRPSHTVIIRSPVGRQFLIVGLHAGFWLGQGSITSLTPNGELGDKVGDFSDNAYSAGSAFVGLMHVITRKIFFEARFGAGAVWFPNDRLISTDLSAEGDQHVGLLLSAEIRGRMVARSGFTGALGLNLSRVGLPKNSGAFLGVSPSLGYLSWEEGYDGFWLLELGYTLPLINGLEPEIPGSGLNEPIDSQWHMFALTTQFGF